MTYAIIETGGKQLRVETGRFYDIERLAVDVDDKVTIDKVLYVDNDGEALVGQPFVDGATVEGTVMRHLRGRKIIVYKMRPKKKTRKKQGHRQELTRLMIDAINLNGSATSSAPKAEAEAEPVVELAAEPVAELAAEPVVEPAAESIAEPVVEPAAEPVAEPAAEPTAESAAEPVAEPAVEPTAESADAAAEE